MIKKICLAATLLSLSARAHAAFQIVSLPGLPVMPVSAPSAIAPRPLAFPSLNKGVTITLPGVNGIPMIAPAFPTLPMPMIGAPQITLPSPSNPMPLAPNTRVKIIGAPAMRLAAVAAAPAQTEESEAAKTERLERLFDRGIRKDERPRGDETRHTLPENDLLNEIGIQ